MMLHDIDKTDLLASYDDIGSKFLTSENLKLPELKQSRSIFEKESLECRSPVPRKLEVVAVVAGLSFSKALIRKLTLFQTQIQSILGSGLAYWVLPQNLALEFFVIKWPDDEIKNDHFNVGMDFIHGFNQKEFFVEFNGIQIHRDGCVIARGVDQSAIIRRSREPLMKNSLIPERQSNWSHVPLGRILEPFSEATFHELKHLVNNSQTSSFYTEKIDKIHLVHETRWYMEERKIMLSKELRS